MGALGGLTEGNELRKAEEKSKFIIFILLSLLCKFVTLAKNEKKYLVFLVNPDFYCEILLLE